MLYAGNKKPLSSVEGFEFIEFTTLDINRMHRTFLNLGFSRIAKFRGKNIYHYKQIGINLTTIHPR